MGDRTSCSLRMWGIADKSTLDTLQTLLYDEYYVQEQDFQLALEKQSGPLELWFEEEDPALDPSIEKLLIDAGISYDWTWGEGDNYHAGFVLYDAPSETSYHYNLLHDQIALTLDAIDNPEVLDDARKCKALLEETSHQRLHVADSAHERIALLKEHPELASQIHGGPA